MYIYICIYIYNKYIYIYTHNKVDGGEKPTIWNLKFHVINRQLNNFTNCNVTV